MTLFKRTERAPERASASSNDGFSLLSANLTVIGDIESDGTVRLDGRLEGSIRRAAIVVLGSGSSIKGNITAREVLVGGTVEGNIDAADRIELQPSAVVTGDIEAGAVLIREGGIIRGRLNVVRRESSSATEDSRASRRTPSVTMRIPVPATTDAT
jgi:cytoskeletal protein CcmA (bactofilin family)